MIVGKEEEYSFITRSPIQDLKEMLGQYGLYVGYLEVADPGRQLYIAISRKVYEDFFTRKAIQLIVQRYALPFILVDLETEESVKWTKCCRFCERRCAP